jgi:hypothetical protein
MAMDATPETPEMEMERPVTGGSTREKHPADPPSPLEDPGLRLPLPRPVLAREGTVGTEGMSAEGGRGSMIGRLIGGLSRKVGGGERRREREAWSTQMTARWFRVSQSIGFRMTLSRTGWHARDLLDLASDLLGHLPDRTISQNQCQRKRDSLTPS